MAVAATQVKELREKTGVGMMECKKALEEANGDIEAAIKVLRERGIAKAAKREGRTAAEGLVAVAIADDYTAAALAELNSETDFVARNEEFSALVKSIAKAGLKSGASDLESLKAATLEDGRNVDTAVGDIRTKIGEKIELNTAKLLKGDVVSGYIHPPGKIGVLISANAPGIAADKKPALSEGLREIAMHVAAFSPRFLDDSAVDEKVMAEEAEIYATQARNEGKPENIIPRIVEGKLKSFKKDNCLVEQAFAKDPGKTVQQVVKELGQAAGAEVTLTGFERVQVGSKVSD